MKTAKKVLSIVLAVMMVLSTMVIAASASADEAAFEWSLSAEVYNATGAAEAKDSGYEETPNTKNPTLTKQKADVTAYKNLEEHTYVDTSETIYVQPGQVVWLTLHIKTTGGAYLSAYENCVYYTKNLFYSTTNTFAALSVPNPDSTWASYDCMTFNGNAYSRMNATTRKKYTTTVGMSPDTYHCYFLNGKASSPDLLDGILEADFDDDMISFPIYVDPDAALGTEGQIFLGGNFKTWTEGFADLEGDVWGGEPDQWTGAAHKQQAALNFKVGTKPASVDYTALNTAIADFEALKEEDYTADSWANAETAYTAALNAKTATVQATVDAATKALNDAMAALDEAVALDYTRINAAIDAADAADTTNATMSSAAALDDALEAAIAAVATATTQADLDDAAEALEDAIAGLEEKADMTPILEALDYADGLDKADWADESLIELDMLVAAAEAILAQADNFADQDAVDEAAQAIYDMQIMVEMANYTEVWDAQAEAAGLDEEEYTTASWAALEAALDDVDPNLNKSQQATVDGYAAAINAALDGLKYRANTAALAAIVAEADEYTSEDFATNDWYQLQVYVNAAKADYIGKDAEMAAEDKQAEIDQLMIDIQNVLAKKFGPADYTAVNDAIMAIPDDLTVYTTESVEALEEVLDAINWYLKDNYQDVVDGYAQAILDATDALELKKADLTALNNAITAAAAITDASLYTEDSYKAFADALAAAQTLAASAPVLAEQDAVDAAAAALTKAQDDLAYAGADFSAIDEIAENAGDLAREFYTADSLTAYDAAVADALAIYANKAAYTIADQAAINAAAAKGADATSLLVAKDADFTAIDALVADAYALDPSIYTEDSWAAFDTAFADTLAIYNSKADYDIFDQDDIDATAEDGEAAFDLLVLADGDYAEINKYLDQIAALNGDDYTTSSWTALQDFIDTIPMDLKADKQAEIDENAYNLRKAKNALVLAPAGDYSAVDAQIAAFDNMITDIYTADSVKAVEDAIANVTTGLNANHQDEIDAMAKGIEEAIKALVEITYDPADYTAVDAAIADFNAKDQAIYTAESVQAVKDAIAEVVYNLDERYQDEVDGFAAAINTAIEALELLPAPEGRVNTVAYTEGPELVKTYTVAVDGRAAKIQFINEAGNTVTIARTDLDASAIAHFDEEGNEVSDLSRDLAYEEWTVTLNLKPGTYTVISKDAQNGWEATDLGCTFNVVRSTKNADVTKFELESATAGIAEQVNATIVTGKDVLKVQILVDDEEVGKKTFDADTYATDNGDTYTYNVFVKAYSAGAHTLTVRIKTADGWSVYEGVTANLEALKVVK